MVLAVVSVASVTRTISNTSDNLYTKVWNTKGNIWDCSDANIQLAIDDLISSNGGTVWVGSDTTINSPIMMRDHVTLDCQRNEMTLGDDISFIEISGCSYSTVKNVVVRTTTTHTAPIFELYVPVGNLDIDNAVSYNNIEHVKISNPSGTNKDYTGIYLFAGDSSVMHCNSFKNIIMWGGNKAIHLKAPSSDEGWSNYSVFEHIYADSFKTVIDFDCTTAFNYNIFDDIKSQSYSGSVDGVKNINGKQNHFYGCLIWDWYAASNPNHDWSIASGATDTCIMVHYLADIVDYGTGTEILMAD